MSRKLAVVTGASSGIGLEIARCCAADGFDMIVCADEPAIMQAAAALEQSGGTVTAVQADLGTEAGIEELASRIGGREVDVLVANAGIGLRDAFLDQDLAAAIRVVQVNVTGTLSLVHRVGREMRTRGGGRILITGSIAGYLPGSYHAVYNGSKAFLDNFAYALGNELKESGVTVTCLMPGATETRFFERAGLEDTALGASDEKDDAADVARQGYDAMIRGEPGIVTGLKNKLQVKAAGVTPSTTLANMHARQAKPGSAGA